MITENPPSNCGMLESGDLYFGFGGTNIVWPVTTCTGPLILRVLAAVSATGECQLIGELLSISRLQLFTIIASPNSFGVNGFVNLIFAGPALSVDYVDLDGTRVLHEEWISDRSGTVQFVSSQKLVNDPDFHAYSVRAINFKVLD